MRHTDARTFSLADGRDLSYYEFGDSDGTPLIHGHGGLVCGLDAGWADAVARQRGVRLISPNRPGLAGSDADPGRTTRDWAADIAELADHLGIDRFLMAGWSMGGQYALTCAAMLPELVSAVGVLAGAPPLDDPATFAELNSMDHRLTLLSRHHPKIAKAEFEGMGEVAAHTPAIYNDIVIHDLAPVAAAASRALPKPGLAAAFAPALQSAAGMVEEYVAWAKPWGSTLEDVAVPVHVFRGTQDQLVPRRWMEAIAEGVPRGTSHEIAGADHMLPLTHYGEIMDTLLNETRSGGRVDGNG